MSPKISFAEITADKIVYNHSTRLFSFSPRREIDSLLIAKLRRSMAETGNWQPIVVKADTMEGIAGNHRFLAALELAREQGIAPEQCRILAILLECDEGTAIAIALAENEVRQNLTQWETIQALIKTVERKPKVAEAVFEVDGEVVEQLRLWEKELDYEKEWLERKRMLQAQLTREWVALINDRLAAYPELHAQFLEQLRHPSWVQARSLEELDRAITRALLQLGVQFIPEKTWNSTPPHQCLGCQMDFAQLQEKLRQGGNSLTPQANGIVPGFCPHLRLFPENIPQFRPDPAGKDLLEIGAADKAEAYPAQALTPDGRNVRGHTTQLLQQIDAYCVEPNLHQPESCFAQRENETAQATMEALQQQGLQAMLPAFVAEQKRQEHFIWLHPKREGQPCEQKDCLHAADEQPGFVIIAKPGGICEMACVHPQCGTAAQEALVDWEARERKQQELRREAALDKLRQTTVEQTLLAAEADFSGRAMLETIEAALVPGWDTPTMFHVVWGWQAAMRAQSTTEIISTDKASGAIARELPRPLADKPTCGNIKALYAQLRAYMTETDAGLRRWVACLAVVRGWRDQTETEDQIEEATRSIQYDCKA